MGIPDKDRLVKEGHRPLLRLWHQRRERDVLVIVIQAVIGPFRQVHHRAALGDLHVRRRHHPIDHSGALLPGQGVVRLEKAVVISLDNPRHLAGGHPAAGIFINIQGVLKLVGLHHLQQRDLLQGRKPGHNGAHLLPGQGVLRGKGGLGGPAHQAVLVGPAHRVVVGESLVTSVKLGAASPSSCPGSSCGP